MVSFKRKSFFQKKCSLVLSKCENLTTSIPLHDIPIINGRTPPDPSEALTTPSRDRWGGRLRFYYGIKVPLSFSRCLWSRLYFTACSEHISLIPHPASTPVWKCRFDEFMTSPGPFCAIWCDFTTEGDRLSGVDNDGTWQRNDWALSKYPGTIQLGTVNLTCQAVKRSG